MMRGENTEQKIVYLDQYPFDECYRACYRYECGIDWNAVSQEIKSKKCASFDISDCIDIFEHLQLDENYVLISYVTNGYHGMFGRVAAIPKDQKGVAKQEVDDQIKSLPSLKLPEVAAPPMEAVYNDGTAEGYLEALLCERLIAHIPLSGRFGAPATFIVEPPKDLQQRWNLMINIPDWRPRAVFSDREGCTLLAFSITHEDQCFAPITKNSISLKQYNFSKDLVMHWLREAQRNAFGKPYPAEIENNKRYKEGKCCCVSACSSILIAEEK